MASLRKIEWNWQPSTWRLIFQLFFSITNVIQFTMAETTLTNLNIKKKHWNIVFRGRIIEMISPHEFQINKYDSSNTCWFCKGTWGVMVQEEAKYFQKEDDLMYHNILSHSVNKTKGYLNKMDFKNTHLIK